MGRGGNRLVVIAVQTVVLSHENTSRDESDNYLGRPKHNRTRCFTEAKSP